MKRVFTLLGIFVLCTFTIKAQWNQSLTDHTSLIIEISVCNDSVVWTKCGNDKFSIIKKGNNMVTKSFPSEMIANGIGGFSAVNESTAYVIVCQGANKGIYKTINQGDNWIKQSTGFNENSTFPNFIYFFNENDGIAVGDPLFNSRFEIYTTSNGGNQWNLVPDANIPSGINEYTFNSSKVYRARGNNFYFLASSGKIYKSTNKGLSWTVINIPSKDIGNLYFDFKDDNNGILSHYTNNTSSKELYSTADGGKNWTLINTTNFYSNIKYIPKENAYLSTHYQYGMSYSVDNGQTWTIHPSLKNVELNAIEHTPSGRIIIGGKKYTYSSSNLKGINLAVKQAQILSSKNIDITFSNNVELLSSQGLDYYNLSYRPVNVAQKINVISATRDIQNHSLVHLVTETTIPLDTITISVSNVNDENGVSIINGSSVALVSNIYTGMIDSKDFSFTIYPNPAQDIIYLKNIPLISSICIYDIYGKEVIKKLAHKTNEEINVNFLKKGIYTIKIGSGKGMMIEKFIKL